MTLGKMRWRKTLLALAGVDNDDDEKNDDQNYDNYNYDYGVVSIAADGANGENEMKKNRSHGAFQ